MEPETNTENWNDDYQTQNQSPSEQPQNSSFLQSQWLQQSWLNVKVTTWLKCLVIIAALTIAVVFIAPKFTSADNQQQDSNFSAGYPEFEDDWYDYGFED